MLSGLPDRLHRARPRGHARYRIADDVAVPVFARPETRRLPRPLAARRAAAAPRRRASRSRRRRGATPRTSRSRALIRGEPVVVSARDDDPRRGADDGRRRAPPPSSCALADRRPRDRHRPRPALARPRRRALERRADQRGDDGAGLHGRARPPRRRRAARDARPRRAPLPRDLPARRDHRRDRRHRPDRGRDPQLVLRAPPDRRRDTAPGARRGRRATSTR